MNDTASADFDVFKDSAKYFATPLQQFQFFDKYSRFDHLKNRRETWVETVDRAVNFLKELSQNKLPSEDYERIKKAILKMEVAPSMRLLAMAGDAARRSNICIYNCSTLPMDSIDSFVEELIISMNGCGVGYSVERQYVNQLPEVQKQTGIKLPVFLVPDTTEGWAEALRLGLQTWFNGQDITFDYSIIRPAGTMLKTKGGRASGPEPLQKLLDFARSKILSRQGYRLSTVDVHDIACMVGTAAVSGGVRRTALISLFDYDDESMRECKNGDNLISNEQRWNANNSAVWDRTLSQVEVIDQMLAMFKGERGEPGIFSRIASEKTKPHRRKSAPWQTNPCGEIQLRPYQFCNLSQIIARVSDTIDTLIEKAEIATIIGTIQSMGTNFPGLRPIWKQNCEEERLLGVDLNGQMDTSLVTDIHVMQQLRTHCVETNERYAALLGINRATAVTCVKPNGNSSVLYNCSSGLHPRFAKFYIRNVRVGVNTPIFQVLKECNVPMSPENGQTEKNATTYVIHFPVRSPKGAITRDDITALDQCKIWLLNKLNFTEHNPSITVNYRPEEMIPLLRWVYEHQDVLGGMSFLPYSDVKLEQLPYVAVTEKEYRRLAKEFPKIDFSLLTKYEKEDETTASQEVACVSGVCSLDDYMEHVKSEPMPLRTNGIDYAQVII